MKRAGDSGGATLLRLDALGVAAAGRVLLAGLDLKLAAGEIVALRGPSGCGKTTLLRTIAMLIDLAAGEIRLEGRAPGDIGWASYRRRVSYLAQRPVLLAGTARDNLALAFAFASARSAELDGARAAELLGRLGLGASFLDLEAGTASEGQQQRLCLVRSLLIEPRVLLLDEPTSALDPETSGLVESLLAQEIARTGAGALLVTHDSDQCERLGARQIDLAPLLVHQPAATEGAAHDG